MIIFSKNPSGTELSSSPFQAQSRSHIENTTTIFPAMLYFSMGDLLFLLFIALPRG